MLSFGYGPTTSCRSPEGICSLPRQDRVKVAGDMLLWLTQAGGSVGYGMWGEPAVAEAGLTLQQPVVHHVLSQGSCPWIKGSWQWWAAQAPRRHGVDSDLCLHTGFLVAAAAALAFHAHLWCPC